MAESNQMSHKRMRFSSSPASEELATIKSHNQRDRSGRIAPAVSRTGKEFCINQSPSLIGKTYSKIIRTYPRATIKDLRLRRVFSPSSISSDWEFNAKGENQTKEQYKENPSDSNNSNIAKEGIKINAGGFGNVEAENFLQTTPPDSELFSNGSISAVKEAERICEEINAPAVKNSLCSKSVLRPCSRAKIFKNPGSFSYKRLLPYLMQAADDVTASGRCSKPGKSLPSNINLSCNKETVEFKITGTEDPEEGGELMIAKCQLPETTKPVCQSVDRVFNKQIAGSLCENSSPSNRAISSSPNKKHVISRRKLFKTPGSVNYRRMLPYLRDIQGENPCVSETFNHPDHQKNKEENTPSSMLVCENEGTQEIVTSNVARESDTCFNENKEPLPCELVSLERSDSDKEQEAEVKHVIPDTEMNLGTPLNVLASEISVSSPLVDSRSSIEVATFVNNVVGEENISNVEKTEAKSRAEQVEANSLNLTAELRDPPVSISPSKGILKMSSIKGCRGICTCLNCSSFRLNAERAFEFSRNQLQDTEVMVLDLVGEISRLRDMLEKYDSADHNDSYKTQLGEAAKRACEATELAKSRIHQMNDDLQVHCRIPNEQRARVKFGHY